MLARLRRQFDRCAICELPRFCHGWRITRRHAYPWNFREPIR